ncbi:RTA1 like protein-domain-containing protein [Exophiala viscosa]|uniref:RTA1 like protein-domain-containing protein n=1 Tax=Exophiala viscosa TaxID=2486360 RepID=UPI002195DFB6|nr:RTA1 like protein-domain-containing protein [Exophiala viscosa]
MAPTCNALTDPNTLWNFCPSLGAAYALTVFFGLAFLAHVTQGIYHRKWYTWVICMGALWQTIAYIFRILSIEQPGNLGNYAAWFVLILVAPLWTNAFVYIVVGRMVWNFVPTAKILGLTAWRFGTCFVVLDIIAFITQVYGAASAEQESNSVSQTLQGLHIYMAGVGIQQLFILIFVFFATQLHRVLLRGVGLDKQARKCALTLLYTVYAVLALITMRIIFRLCEYSNGLNSTIPNHEAYQYCLDSLPMLLAFILLNVVHPGRIMSGKECDIPSRKERKKTGDHCKRSFADVEASFI